MKRFFKYLVISCSFIFNIINFNAASSDQLPNSLTPTIPNPFLNNSYIANPPFYYSNSFLQLGMQYSALFGSIINSKFTQRIGHDNALALEIDYGENSNRIGGTWGILLTPNQLLKFSAERLAQQLTFNFFTGSIERTIPQYAYGSTYSFVIADNNDLNISAYYANANSKSLAAVNFVADGSDYIDYRHIAGARSDGGSLGFDISPWKTGSFGAALNYDQVHYNNFYILQDTSVNDNQFGVTLRLEQLLTDNLKVNISASKRAPYDEYEGGFSWLFSSSPAEIMFSIVRTISHNSTPNDTQYLVTANIGFDESISHHFYAAPTFVAKNNLLTWTNIPAVHMSSVLAATDELIQKIGLEISSIFPNSGPASGGTVVTITGNGFTPTTNVLFGGINGLNIQFINNRTLIVTTPPFLLISHPAATHLLQAASNIVDVTVSNIDGSTATLPNGFTYLNITPPTPVSINPNIGPTTGGTNVTINGSNFTGTTAVTFGGVAATNIVVANDTTITCTTPSHAAGAVNVVITNSTGSGTLNNGFTYLNNPTPISVTPNFGAATGNEPVTINGANFTGTTSVTFGGAPATNVVVVNDNSITCNTPAHAVGVVNVVVTNHVGSGTLSNGFTFEATPSVVSVSPNFGVATGGDPVTISGNNFSGTTSVTFGGTAATNVVVVNDTTITCTTPAHAAGTFDVVVTNHVGSGTLSNGFTFEATTSLVTGFHNFGITASGSPVPSDNSNFIESRAVTFGGVAAYNVANSNRITNVIQVYNKGYFEILAANYVGSETSDNDVKGIPSITHILPENGPIEGGNPVTIYGNNFIGVTAVTFGNIPATNIVVVNNNIIRCLAPSHINGKFDVNISNSIGTGTLHNGYSFQ